MLGETDHMSSSVSVPSATVSFGKHLYSGSMGEKLKLLLIRQRNSDVNMTPYPKGFETTWLGKWLPMISDTGAK